MQITSHTTDIGSAIKRHIPSTQAAAPSVVRVLSSGQVCAARHACRSAWASSFSRIDIFIASRPAAATVPVSQQLRNKIKRSLNRHCTSKTVIYLFLIQKQSKTLNRHSMYAPTCMCECERILPRFDNLSSSVIGLDFSPSIFVSPDLHSLQGPHSPTLQSSLGTAASMATVKTLQCTIELKCFEAALTFMHQ